MKLIFITDHMKFSGGRRLMFDYALYLKKQGHDVEVLVEKREGELADYIPVRTVANFSRANIPECDLIIATSPKEVKLAHLAGRGKVVHFCQGFELIDLEQRLEGRIVPPRYQGKGILRKLRLMRKKITWRKKYKSFDNVYKLPTHLIAITVPMCRELEERYHRKVHLCRNGVDLNILHPRSDWKPESFSESNPMRIVNIGPVEVTYKGIPVTFKAIEKAKNLGIPIELTRITPIKPLDEKENPPPFEYKLLLNLSREELCEVLRENDVYISNSTEREGFGLPAMEAMASGLLAILSEITAYKSFTDRRDHCLFVPEGNVEATVNAIEKVYKMDPEELAEIRKNALEVASGFSHEKACAEFERILKEILNSE